MKTQVASVDIFKSRSERENRRPQSKEHANNTSHFLSHFDFE